MSEEFNDPEALMIHKEHEKIDAELRKQETQVENIIQMIKDEFNLDNEEINSDKSGDTGFEDFYSNNPSDKAYNENYEPGSDELNTEFKNENKQDQNYDRDENVSTLDDYYNINDVVDDNEGKKYQELNEFIQKAIEFGANALDLSKKDLKKVPRKLIGLKSLQYIYMEGNQLTKLPNNFFQVFTQLKWLDLRNNCLTEIPKNGLDRHENLRYLLLENNQIKRLPCEISNLKNLTAINLTDNPIEYPPLDFVQKGCKPIQEYMKNDYLNSKISEDKDSACSKSTTNDNDTNEIKSVTDDVWASDDESDDKNKNSKSRLSRSMRFSDPATSYMKNCDFRIKSATRNLLIAKSMRPSDAQSANSDLRERLNKAKLNANIISKNVMRLLNKRKSMIPNEITIYKNEEYEKAANTGKIEKYKREKEKIDAKLQKVNDKVVRDEFRDELKKEQRKLFNKRLIKGVDYVEPVLNAPFDISEDHLQVMTNEERAALDKKLELDRIRSLSPETLWRIEEERRIRDHQLQDKIREYTNKLLNRRYNKNDNPKYDKIQAAKDIRELRAIHREIEQRRYEIQFNLRAYTGGLAFRETAKLNSKAKLSRTLKGNKV